MKALKARDLQDWTPADLRARIAELEEERFRLNFRSATEPLEEPLRLRGVRKDIARLHTVLNQKERSPKSEVRGVAPAKKSAAKKTVKTAAKKQKAKAGGATQ